MMRPTTMTRRALTLLVLLSLAGCGGAAAGDRTGGAAAGVAAGSAWPADRTFRSTRVTEGGRERALVDGTRIELDFHADGRLSARVGCNHLGGTGRIDGQALVLTDLNMTEMGCDPALMAQDGWLSGILGARPAWRLDGDRLTLTGAGVVIELTDRRVTDPDRPLLGTRWTVDTLVSGDTVSSLPDGTRETYVEFDRDGRVRAVVGCPVLHARATVRGDRITFAPPTTGEPVCDLGGSVVTALQEVLRGEVSYRIKGSRLTLTAAGGKGLGLGAAG